MAIQLGTESLTGRRVKRVAVALAVLLALGVTACGPHGQPSGPRVLVGTSDALLDDAAWTADGSIFFLAWDYDNSDGPASVERIDPDGNQSTVDLSGLLGSRCGLSEVVSLRTLPDGRLGLVARCLRDAGTSTALAMGPADQKAQVLGMTHGGDRAVWLPGLRTGWSEADHYDEASRNSCSGVAPIDRTQRLPAPVVTPGGPPVDRNFAQCAAPGGAATVAVSDTGQVYLWTDAGGGATATLYRLGADRGATPVVSGFDAPLSMVSTPDGRLVVSAGYRGVHGMWLIDPVGGTVRSLAPGNFGEVSLSPRADAVASTRYHDNGGGSELVTMSLAP